MNMNCDNCGNKLDSSDKFCTKCGTRVDDKPHLATSDVSNEKWWLRLLKVGYILLYIPLIITVIATWFINSTSWDYYTGYTNTYGTAFWYSLLSLAICMVIIRIIKIAVLYVVIGQKPLWKKEFKRWY